MHPKKQGALALITLGFAFAGLTGCSHRPSRSDLSDAIYADGNAEHPSQLWLGLADKNLDRAGSACMAGVLARSDISDEALEAIANRDATYKIGDDDQVPLAKVTEKLGECMGVTGDPSLFLQR